jgi:putative Ca2+/H+ antiporter (TMEM165/GDT1 family)
MDAFLVSAATVAVAEIGDKTQLLAMLLAARFKATVPIVLGIAAATALNHMLAALLGVAAGDLLPGVFMRWLLALSFIGMGVWCLLPDRLDHPPDLLEKSGAFVATLVSFFFVEMGDKTQLATVALAANYGSVLRVAAGTTLGMLIADVPAVYVGNFAIEKIPLRFARSLAAVLFFGLAAATLIF